MPATRSARPARVVSGAAFRATAIAAAAFVAILVVTTSLGVWLARAATIGEMRGEILEELSLLARIEAEGGAREVAMAVDDLARRRVVPSRLVGVFSPQGRRLSGDLDVLPSFQGWGKIAGFAGQPPVRRTYLVHIVRIDDVILVVGRSEHLLMHLQGVLVRTAAGSILVLAAAVLALGYWSSRAVSDQLGVIADTLESFSLGSRDARIDLVGSSDRISVVASRINANLDRLSELMETMRRTGIAVAHDLRTPLARASLHLQEAAREPGQPDHVEAALRELDTLGATFDTILRISQIETAEVHLAPVDLAALARELAETYEPVFEEAGLALALDAPRAVAVPGDRRMLAQALVNVFENVLRHCPAGSRLAVSVRAEDGDGVVDATDDGPGVPADELDRLFTAFHRSDPARGPGGTGLGLALVRAVVERHGGTVGASLANPGLRITLRLPGAVVADHG